MHLLVRAGSIKEHILYIMTMVCICKVFSGFLLNDLYYHDATHGNDVEQIWVV